jgi:MerR family transcriptional regulator, light-induced transcriptional regulator
VRDPQQNLHDPNAACAEWANTHNTRHTKQPIDGSDRSNNRQRAFLEQIVATKIIPRLLIADLPGTALTSVVPAATKAANVGEFAELIVDRDAEAAIAYFETLQARGVSLEALFQDLLAPTALRLGELWDEDINDFIEVTRGFSHLQQIVRLFSDDFKAEGRRPSSDRRALLMPVPGEHHAFGISLVGQHFRREGWRVWGGPPNSHDEILELVEAQWFDVVGLSISSLDDPRILASAIANVRKASCNKDLTILVGGKVFNELPGLVTDVGGDATARDGKQAVMWVQQRIGIQRRTL